MGCTNRRWVHSFETGGKQDSRVSFWIHGLWGCDIEQETSRRVGGLLSHARIISFLCDLITSLYQLSWRVYIYRVCKLDLLVPGGLPISSDRFVTASG
jgi:hypothetical protein